MSNPNNVSLHSVHEVTFIDSHALTIPTLTLLNDDGELIKGAQTPSMDKTTALKIYDTMRFIRLLDERMQAAQRQGRVSFYMQCLGEEASVTASAAALKDDDMIMAQYREQAALKYRGFSLEQFMNQMFSNEQDLGKGRQMPIHYGSKALHYLTISSPLGTQIPQASGYAYGQKLKHLNAQGELESDIENITICYFGEGAASEGDFHAGLNMAAVHESPVIFYARNNGYAISTPADEQFAGDGIASRGVGYGMKTIRVNGEDALAVYEATKAAREYITKTSKPVLIEAIAYRLGAHSTSDDPTGYRTKDEEAPYREKCPVNRFRKYLLKQGWLDEAEDEKAKEQIKADILAALKVAEKIAKPPLEDLVSDVYDTPIPALNRQYEELKTHIKAHPDAYPVTSGRLK